MAKKNGHSTATVADAIPILTPDQIDPPRDLVPVAASPPQDTALAQRSPLELLAPKLSEAASAFLAGAGETAKAPSRIPFAKIMHREAEFLLPSGELVPELVGYPIYYFQTRKFYKKPPRPGEKGSPPDCWSPDLIKPSPQSADRQSDLCMNCPHSLFGSGRDDRSQACTTVTWLFLLNPQYGNPPVVALMAPPSSIRALLGSRFDSGYLAQAAARYGAYQLAWTKIGLRREGGDQVPYCVLEPVMGPCADTQKAQQLAAIHKRLKEDFEAMRGATAEVAEAE